MVKITGTTERVNSDEADAGAAAGATLPTITPERRALALGAGAGLTAGLLVAAAVYWFCTTPRP